MSNQVNDALIEEANVYINSGELSSMGALEKALIWDLQSNDMEALWAHVSQARNLLREE